MAGAARASREALNMSHRYGEVGHLTAGNELLGRAMSGPEDLVAAQPPLKLSPEP